MLTSTAELKRLLDSLTVAARNKGLNDASWASAAGFSKETLSRLRRRSSCDLSTLLALADAVGASLAVTIATQPATTSDGHFPSELSRDYERQLLALCASRRLDPAAWAAAGPAFFMAGLAVMLASNDDADCRGLRALAGVILRRELVSGHARYRPLRLIDITRIPKVARHNATSPNWAFLCHWWPTSK